VKEDEVTHAILDGLKQSDADVLIKVGCELISTTRCWRHDDGYLIIEVDENEYAIQRKGCR